jgi:hypothetical protein
LLDAASIALHRNSYCSVQVLDSSCGQSLGAGGRWFKSNRPDQISSELVEGP